MPDATEASQLFRILADPTRLRLLMTMAEAGPGGVCVGALCEALGQSQPAVSYHVGLLRFSGVIEPRREGKNNFYTIRPDGRFAEAMAFLGAIATKAGAESEPAPARKSTRKALASA